jgi:hypothetical protein
MNFYPNYKLAEQSSGVTIGTPNNTSNIFVQGGYTASGPIEIYGGVVYLYDTAPLSVTSSSDAIRIEAHDYIIGLNAMSTNGGAVILRSNKRQTAFHRSILIGNVTTNGGPIWAGGGSGTSVWNGLTVGDGFATGSGSEHGISVGGMLDTRTTSNPAVGGDIMLVGSGEGLGRADISAKRTDFGVREVYAGNGDITLLSRDGIHIYAGSGVAMAIKTTGTLSFAPLSGTNWQTEWNFTGNLSGANMLGNNVGLWGIHLYDFATLGGLNLGTYSGTGLAGDDAYVAANTQDITISSDLNFCPIGVIQGRSSSTENTVSDGKVWLSKRLENRKEISTPKLHWSGSTRIFPRRG